MNKRHGGPYDRGAADSYYQRGPRPHYFKGDTYTSEEVLEDGMTKREIAEYMAGFQANEAINNFKEW